MATDLATRKTTSKSEAYLQSKFAELCARIQRVDLITHLLVLSVTVLGYAFVMGIIDWLTDNSTPATVRWPSYLAFLALFGCLLLQTIRCWLRRVNPYFVAHQLEQTLPDAKNSLINWLDLHDEAMPLAFQKTLSARAAEQLKESDADRTVKKRTNWILLGVVGTLTLGLLVLLILGPSAFASSMLRAFAPFYTPPTVARTTIDLLQPESGDAEVSPTQSITFAAKIEGRVPTGNRPDAPKLLYRYQASEDYLTKPLQSDGDVWTTQLHAAQLRTGFTYKLSAGDAETPEHQVRVRAAAHVKQFEITYQHPPYRKLPRQTVTIPNHEQTMPIIAGMRGSSVELVIHASRPVQKASVEIVTAKLKRNVEIRMLADDAFACNWTLDQPGQFRVTFTAKDGEDNADRDWYPIDVPGDEAPVVVLTQPGKDVQLPENGTLELEGHASSPLGIKNLTLHFRVLNGSEMLPSKVYRPELSLKLEDGSYVEEVLYMDVVPLDQFKNDKGTLLLLAPGTVIEYWLEATDGSDYQTPPGNVGKSAAYKITLTPAPKDPTPGQQQRKNALNRYQQHQKAQDNQFASQKKNQGGNGGSPSANEQNAQNEKKKNEDEEKIKKALDKEKNEKPGGAKSSEQNDSTAKGEPQKSPNGPQPQKKDQSQMPDNAGAKKDQGAGSGGEPKDGQEKKPKDSASKGDRKDGPMNPGDGAKDGGPMKMQEPTGGTKGAGPMGANQPMPQQPKEQAPDDGGPMPIAKQDKTDANAKNEPTPGTAKGNEQNGPEASNKDSASTSNPNGKSKGGTMNDGAGEPKQGSADSAKPPGAARGDNSKGDAKESWEPIASKIDPLAKGGEQADKAGAELAKIAKNSDDPRKSDLAKEILKANGRDPSTGKLEKKKGPNPFALKGGPFAGLSDDVKTAAANREFAARIGQMQLDDWKKRMTPDLLKKAGMSEADWQRYLKATQAYNVQVRQRNEKLLRDALQKELRGSTAGSVRDLENTGTRNDSLSGRASPPADLRDALERFTGRAKSP